MKVVGIMHQQRAEFENYFLNLNFWPSNSCRDSPGFLLWCWVLSGLRSKPSFFKLKGWKCVNIITQFTFIYPSWLSPYPDTYWIHAWSKSISVYFSTRIRRKDNSWLLWALNEFINNRLLQNIHWGETHNFIGWIGYL